MNELWSAVASARTLLFVGGDRPDRFAKAAVSGADHIVIDLEDAVGPEAKGDALNHAQAWLEAGGHAVIRINGRGTPWHEAELDVLSAGPVCVMVPKAQEPDDIDRVISRLAAGSCVVPLLETASGVLAAPSIARTKGVVRLAFGNGDLATQLGVSHTNREGLAWARSALALASAAAGLPGPVDGVTTALRDDSALFSDSRHAVELGFTGKLCIHPGQIPTVHSAFAPSTRDVEWAREILLISSGRAVAVVEGQFVDKPLLDRARQIIARATTCPPAQVDQPGATAL
ncbi:HpcH/HpaI aldolase/citrate lyase family protein [Amycolatopsis thermoflava]|uniref:HpcH/HpaI aldolase/citrate lyase family protein n=1 Tax=Amycolatopsis thermoflava TaxID=84480 RepID=UPI0004231C28|nr:CoA ester lyase [Amycolatopsis thermoflava]